MSTRERARWFPIYELPFGMQMDRRRGRKLTTALSYGVLTAFTSQQVTLGEMEAQYDAKHIHNDRFVFSVLLFPSVYAALKIEGSIPLDSSQVVDLSRQYLAEQAKA